ncbi:MAG: methyl-accepting chemotaxis protein, partial [Treponema sp.]|nr:methyl-accepting chemotaxis protein [Treponema sp.]
MRYLNLDIQNAIAPALNLADSLASIIPNMENLADIDLYLADLMATVPAAFEMYYGTVISRFDGGLFFTATDWKPYIVYPDWDQVKRPWFITAMQNPGKTIITEPYEDSSTGKICVTMVKTVNDGEKIIGVVGVDVFLDVLTEIVTSRKITNDGNTFIINNEGLYIVHQNTDYVMNNNFFESEGSALKKYFSSEMQVILQKNTYWAFMPVSGMDWYMVSTGSTDELDRDFWRILTITIISGVALAFVAALVSLRFSLLLTKPIVRLFGILKSIATGDLTRKIEAKGKDEISRMTLLLHDTQGSIKNLIVSIKNEASKLTDIGNNLAVNMNETAAAVNEITANTLTIKERFSSQSASVSDTHKTMEELVTNINRLNVNVEDQSLNVSRASSAIEEMVANIQSVTKTLVNNSGNVRVLSEASEVGRNGLQDVAADIHEISRESEGLMEINSVMQNIASQTNLLSMNAAIEAAHAGEAGKGFAVVADEIRKLAENSGRQSKTISEVLKKIKSSIEKIGRSTGNVLDKFEAIDSNVRIVAVQEENIRNAMEEQGIGSKEIIDSISYINEVTRQVKSDSREMLGKAHDVIRERESLEKVTNEITYSMNDLVAGAENIHNSVNYVNDISNKNREY